MTNTNLCHTLALKHVVVVVVHADIRETLLQKLLKGHCPHIYLIIAVRSQISG